MNPSVAVERVTNLIDPALNRLSGLSLDEARRRLWEGPAAVQSLQGSFALVDRRGQSVRLARSLDRPMRYFLAKRREGPALIVADRIDAIAAHLATEGLADQFHPSYTRMSPAHYLLELQLVGCPDPDPVYQRFFTPVRDAFPPDLDMIGARYIGALADSISHRLEQIASTDPVGVAFSGGVDSGAVFTVTYHVMRTLGMNLGRLKAFTLEAGGGPDLNQARDFLKALDLELFLEPIQVDPDTLDPREAVALIEDYKRLDVECATMGIALCRGIRQRYPEWRNLFDGDGGDENLKDYPIEENPELTIRSVVNNRLLYHEGWGVGRIKHSLTYSGGLSRGFVRTYAPARKFGFEGFSPFTAPSVVEVAEGIPFASLTNYDVATLYGLKGEIVRRGVAAVTGMQMPVFEKRRFQHGALGRDSLRARLPADEARYREWFAELTW